MQQFYGSINNPEQISQKSQTFNKLVKQFCLYSYQKGFSELINDILLFVIVAKELFTNLNFPKHLIIISSSDLS